MFRVVFCLLLLLGAATGLGLFLGWRQWHRASRFLPKSESKRVRATQTIQYK